MSYTVTLYYKNSPAIMVSLETLEEVDAMRYSLLDDACTLLEWQEKGQHKAGRVVWYSVTDIHETATQHVGLTH